MISLVVLAFIVIVAITSVGAGHSGWYQWQHTDLIPPVQDEGPTISVVPPSSVARASPGAKAPVPASTTRTVKTCSPSRCAASGDPRGDPGPGLLSVTLGVMIGALAGFFGGWTDSVLMRITDVILILPLLVIVSVAAFSFGASGLWSVALALGLFSWTGLARLVQAEFLALRAGSSTPRVAGNVAGADHLQAHPAQHGGDDRRLDDAADRYRHILTSALSFIGFGIQAPNVSLSALVDYDTAFGFPTVAVRVPRR
ncbi:MAG: ABC transporter permease subunit [Ilumatobacteraceae bacterium]